MKRHFLIIAAAALIIACNNKSENAASEKNDSTGSMSSNMSSKTKEERNKQTISEAINAINAGNVDEMAKSLAPEVVDHGDGSMPAAKSADSVKSMMHMFVNTFPDMKIDPIVTTTDGDYVIVYSNWTGTFKNDMMGIKATGKSFKTRDADIFKFNDEGK
jgi:predicted ester cyclase